MPNYITMVRAQEKVRQLYADGATGLSIANELGKNSAHISDLMNNDNLSPALAKAMIASGWFDPPPKRGRIELPLPHDTKQVLRQRFESQDMARLLILAAIRPGDVVRAPLPKTGEVLSFEVLRVTPPPEGMEYTQLRVTPGSGLTYLVCLEDVIEVEMWGE